MSDIARTVSSSGVCGIGAMAEDEVDEVELQAGERAVDRLHQVLAVQRVLLVGGRRARPQ
jgi:hypothetical protein